MRIQKLVCDRCGINIESDDTFRKLDSLGGNFYGYFRNNDKVIKFERDYCEKCTKEIIDILKTNDKR